MDWIVLVLAAGRGLKEKRSKQCMVKGEEEGTDGVGQWAVKRHPRDPWNALPYKIAPQNLNTAPMLLYDHEALITSSPPPPPLLH